MKNWREWPVVIEWNLLIDRIKLHKKKIAIVLICLIIGIIGLDIAGKSVYKSVYDHKIRQILGIPNSTISNNIYDKDYSCENNNSVTSRGYIYIHGYKEHNIHAFDYERALLANDTKTKGILDFDYNETVSTYTLCRIFLGEFNLFVSEHDFNEIIIFARSAGGNIISYCAKDLIFNGTIEIHTLASPLKGYNVEDKYLSNRYGIERELGRGYGPYEKPPSNIRVYHHKTVEDESLRSWCGIYDYLCDPVNIQNNNVPGSQEFFYPGFNHSSIVQEVSKIVIGCHN